MVTILRERIISDGKVYAEGVCLSTDTKPTTFCNGSKMYEMDTAFTSYYNEDSSSWTTAPETEGGE